MKTRLFSLQFLILAMSFIATSCSDDTEESVPVPESVNATFNYVFDSENPNKIKFTAQPDMDSWYTHWDFGDNSSAEGMEASKVYLKKGDYDVRFKIFTDVGTAESVQTVSINADFQGPNILQNGELNDNQSWTVLSISDGVNVAFQDGKAVWTGGNWGHVGIYQEVQVQANNKYQINMDIKGSGLSDSWFEVYIGMTPPSPGSDYNDGGIRMGLNTWEGCGSTPFDGQFTDLSCVGGDGTFQFDTAGTAYLVIRGGGASYGDTGVAVDNVSIRSLE